MCLLAHKLHSMLIFEYSSTTYHNLMVCAETAVTTNTILLLLLLLLLGEMIICGRCGNFCIPYLWKSSSSVGTTLVTSLVLSSLVDSTTVLSK